MLFWYETSSAPSRCAIEQLNPPINPLPILIIESPKNTRELNAKGLRWALSVSLFARPESESSANWVVETSLHLKDVLYFRYKNRELSIMEDRFPVVSKTSLRSVVLFLFSFFSFFHAGSGNPSICHTGQARAARSRRGTSMAHQWKWVRGFTSAGEEYDVPGPDR